MYSIKLSNFSLSKAKTIFRFKYSKHFKKILNNLFWFSVGAFLSLFFFISVSYFLYQKIYDEKVYPGIYIENIDFGGKTQEDVKNYFDQKNEKINKTNFQFISDYGIATVSAKKINLGYNSELLSVQALQLGRSSNIFSNISLIIQAYTLGIKLSPSYTYSQEELNKNLEPLKKEINKSPIDAEFVIENGKVTKFNPSQNGQEINIEKINSLLENQTLTAITSAKEQTINLPIPIKILMPKITTEKANNMGIKELIGEGHSSFYHSIPGRVFNVNLASSRVNGILIAPGETFSFVKTLGDVSAFTGYKQAYIIQGGRTVLGDGGGVCQVSTTLFRALLDAGLPIVERSPHAYRVSYYEQNSLPGIDATVYVPTVDLKFKNDTQNYILIQREIDLNNLTLSYYLYGTKDGRKVTMTKPVITKQTPPPPPLYQDDPNLPAGEIKQIDFEAWGANVYFSRTVEKNGQTIISENFISNYRPWQAVYLRGTKS